MADGDSYLGYAQTSGHSIYILGICNPSYEGLIRTAVDNSQGTNGMGGPGYSRLQVSFIWLFLSYKSDV